MAVHPVLTRYIFVRIEVDQPVKRKNGGVAQTEEQVTENHRVEDSSAFSAASGNSASGLKYAPMHSAETIRKTDAARTRDSLAFKQRLPQRAKEMPAASPAFRIHFNVVVSRVWLRRLAVTEEIAGSKPARRPTLDSRVIGRGPDVNGVL